MRFSKLKGKQKKIKHSKIKGGGGTTTPTLFAPIKPNTQASGKNSKRNQTTLKTTFKPISFTRKKVSINKLEKNSQENLTE